MRRMTDYGKEFKNGNINLKYDAETIRESKRDWALIFSDVLFWLDTHLVGEEFCLSNYEMGIALYNNYSDNAYIFNFSDIEKLHAGKTIKLYATRDNELLNDIREEWEKII